MHPTMDLPLIASLNLVYFREFWIIFIFTILKTALLCVVASLGTLKKIQLEQKKLKQAKHVSKQCKKKAG